jgi:hypothetical protein
MSGLLTALMPASGEANKRLYLQRSGNGRPNAFIKMPASGGRLRP